MKLIRPILGVAAVIAIALSVGCASDRGTSENTKSMESLSGTKASVAKAQAEVDRVILSLNALASGNDLPNAYKSFEEQVAALRTSAADAAKRATMMKDKKESYIKMWQREMESEPDPALREQRKAAVQTNYDAAQIAGQDVRQAYPPFNQHLRDIQNGLLNNLTPAALAQIRPTIDQARYEGMELKNRLAHFDAALSRMQAGLAPTEGTAK